MTNKKWRMCLTGLTAMIFLGGCALAVPESGMEKKEDRLVGVFITKDYLDLYDMDGYLSAHGNLLTEGGEVTLPNDPRYQGRLYAQIDKTGGDADWAISFGDVSGEYMLYLQLPDEDGEVNSICFCTDGICDINTSTDIRDDREEYGIEGTMYILPGQTDEEVHYYENPVYQTAEGDIYAVSGQSFSTGGDSSEGAVFSMALGGEITVTENGRVKTEKSNVNVHYTVVERPVQITLYQMGQAHQVMRQDTYQPGEVPEKLNAEPGAEYILAETEKQEVSGEKSVSRELVEYDPDGETYLETFCVLDGGIVTKLDTEVNWNK